MVRKIFSLDVVFFLLSFQLSFFFLFFLLGISKLLKMLGRKFYAGNMIMSTDS